MRRWLTTVIPVALYVTVFAAPAGAKDLWVLPVHVETPQLALTWPVTEFGLARFGFGVPDDMDAFVGARIVFLPAASSTGTYSVFAEVKRDGETIAVLDVLALQDVAISFVANEITEVDVTMLFDGAFDATSAGNDYVSLLIVTPGDPIASARVLGLRFVYDAPLVDTDQIANNAINSAKVADGSLTSADIANNTLTAADIGAGAVGSSELAANAVTSDKIVNGQVTSADIANLGVTNADLAANAVDSSKILDNAVTTADIANGNVLNADLATNAVNSVKIQDGTVTSADIANSTITGTDVANGSLTGADISDNSLGIADIGSSAVGGSELATIRAVGVECQGECTDSTLGQICDVAGAGWEPVAASDVHAFSSSGSGCGGDNECAFFGSLSRGLSLGQVCLDGSGWDCTVYCIAPGGNSLQEAATQAESARMPLQP